MRLPVRFAFQRIERTFALEAYVRKLCSQLELCSDGITRCHVTLVGPHSDSDGSALFLAKIELSVPGAQIYADNNHAGSAGHSDIFLAMHDAYDNAKRQLASLPRNIAQSASP
jgi:hypothetical protein